MMPSLWYQTGLHCRTPRRACPYDVAGWTMSGLPGVFIGHNDRIAWGFTNLGPDVTDLVLEKVDGDTYLVDGEQVPMTTRAGGHQGRGRRPVTITVRETVDGPLVSDVADIDTYTAVGADAPGAGTGLESSPAVRRPPRGDGYAVALRWTALTPTATFDAFDVLNTATDWEGFRDAAAKLGVPAQNLIYADVEGNIGYQAPGMIPIREGYDGKWPVPGWDSRYQWKGNIPFPALPTVQNPPEGWIVTANQAVIGPQYPFFITDDWSYGAAQPADRRPASRPRRRRQTIDADAMRTIQMDACNELAAFLVPKLQALPPPTASTAAVALLRRLGLPAAGGLGAGRVLQRGVEADGRRACSTTSRGHRPHPLQAAATATGR